MKLSVFDKVDKIRYEINKIKTFVQQISTKPTCIATSYTGSSPQKLFIIETNLANAIIAELERQIDELKNQLNELGVEVDE